jgi:hypothetical protein
LQGNIRLDTVKFEEHCLDLNIVVLSEIADLALKLINLLVFLLLTFNEDYTVVK